jgi:hypothetical protein
MDAAQFKQQMAALPKPVTAKKPPFWEAWRLVLYDWILANDPAEFWKCPAVYHTMLTLHWPFQMDYELSQLDLNRTPPGTPKGRWQYALQVPHFGPDDYSTGTRYSMNLIHQAYHLTQWERVTGRRIEQLDTIVEFGGGYGAMALLCRRMGFEGKYVIYDLPEFSLLQEYYLSQFGMLDKTEWNPKKKPKDVDLFMALYSLSEVEPGERMRYLPSVVDSYLFLYSGQWEKWNNVEWFQKELPSKWRQNDKVEWQHTEIAHLPDRNNWYSLGW